MRPINLVISDNVVAILALGGTMLAAVFVAVPASSKDVIQIVASGLVGYLAKSGVDAAKRFLDQPKP